MAPGAGHKLMIGGNVFGHFTDTAGSREILAAARDHNVYAVDTADVYSDGCSEEIIGACLREDRHRWYIATKVGLGSSMSPEGLGRRATICKKIEASLTRLQTDYLDLYQMHHFDPVTPLDETIATFEWLRQQGKIRQAGISNYSVEQLHRLFQQDAQPFTTHQQLLNVAVGADAKRATGLCASHGVQCLAYSVLARGLLHEKYVHGNIPDGSRAAISRNVQSDLTPAFVQRLSAMDRLCDEAGCSIVDAAIGWVVRQADVAYCIVGVKSVDQLSDVARASVQELPSVFFDRLDAIWCE